MSVPVETRHYAPASWTACSVCERHRGDGFLCESCSAPSILVKHETRPHPPQFSLEWWRERIAYEVANPPGEPCFFDAWIPIRIPGGMPPEWDPVPGFR